MSEHQNTARDAAAAANAEGPGDGSEPASLATLFAHGVRIATFCCAEELLALRLVNKAWKEAVAI